jgi:hypothetical protein
LVWNEHRDPCIGISRAVHRAPTRSDIRRGKPVAREPDEDRWQQACKAGSGRQDGPQHAQEAESVGHAVALGLLVTAVMLLSVCWARPSEEKNLTDSGAQSRRTAAMAVRDCSLKAFFFYFNLFNQYLKINLIKTLG